MGTQLIFTVGTNPLPVWIAWFHLKNVLTPKVSEVRLVHTPDTVNERDRLINKCQGANFLKHIPTSPGNPGTVRNDVSVILNNLNPGIDHLHVHYTGGTKVMSVETVAEIEYNPTKINLGTSYLDPRGAAGPMIVDSDGHHLVPDTRVNVTPDIDLIAYLNGFRLGPFRHAFRGKEEHCPAAKEICTISKEMQDALLECQKQNWLSGQQLEQAACAAFREALNSIRRDNCALFHNVYVRRINATDVDKHFELDVVGVLGYQIVVVSCTVDGDNDMIKTKGMEVILRARQLGGDEARAIVLCSANRGVARRVQKELHDEAGSTGTPLQVWGRDKWQQLPDNLENYLRGNDLHWK